MKSFAEYRELDEAFKKGDFIKTPTGEIHRVFDVKGNSLETAPYRGKDGYGGGTTVHKTKATKVAKPSDVTEEVELEEAHQVVAKTKQGETFKSAVYPTKEKALSMHYKMAKSGNYKSVETVPVNEEVEQIDESDLHAQFAAFAASRGGKMTTLADRKKATDDLIAKREKEAAARPKAEPQKITPYKPLGGYDEKSGRSYSEEVEGVAEESEMGDLAHEKTMKHRFLVTYSDPNHTSISMRKEKQQKHVLVPSTKDGNTIYKGEAEPLVKKYMNKQGYKVHGIEHVGMVTKKAN